MKNKPLAIQIWIVFTAFIALIAILLGFTYTFVLKNFFTNEMYKIIESSQEIHLNMINHKHKAEDLIDSHQIQDLQLIRAVSHVFLIYDPMTGKWEPEPPMPAPKRRLNNKDNYSIPIKNLFERIRNNLLSQKETSKRYDLKINGKRLYVITTRISEPNKNIYLISFMWDTYRSWLVRSLTEKLLFLALFLSLMSIFIANFVTKRITAPLMKLETAVEKIARKEWSDPIDIDQQDEIGRLAGSINAMQQELMKQDKEQQTFLQTISHDLKTPVMVIQSYAQALLDGIYLNGSMEETVKVIEKESIGLEKKIKQLLYLTNLEYITERKTDFEIINVRHLMENLITRFSFRRQDLSWSIKLTDAEIYGNAEQLTVLFENLLDNQIRYANKTVKIVFEQDTDNHLNIDIFNDGLPIEEETVENIFKRFYKDKKGEFGLGLAIAKKIVDVHHGSITARNLPNGVVFHITLPLFDSQNNK